MFCCQRLTTLLMSLPDVSTAGLHRHSGTPPLLCGRKLCVDAAGGLAATPAGPQALQGAGDPERWTSQALALLDRLRCSVRDRGCFCAGVLRWIWSHTFRGVSRMSSEIRTRVRVFLQESCVIVAYKRRQANVRVNFSCWLSQERNFNWAGSGPVITVLAVSASLKQTPQSQP